MTLFDTVRSLRTPTLLLLAIFGPRLLPTLLRLLNPRRQPIRPPKPPRRPLTNATRLLLALHSLYWIYHLLFPPYGLFTSHHLPIITPIDVLRRAALGHSSVSSFQPARPGEPQSLVELLLAKLSSLDNRFLYARYGHQPMLTCTWCKDSLDYLLASLPGIAQPYLVQAVVIGVLDWAGGKESSARTNRWRNVIGWLLIVMGVTEVGMRYM